ncbi:hypothetical protein V6N13_083357 [Hibiscus sabdariffa]|uniref:NAC domain-containing protein n=1 Tax=Hibiscus sabdariffa TaxID=183260 RepID=A0ABR2SXS3_9ROSI
MTSDQYMVRIPPGFRFVPTDYELIKYYLLNKLKGQPLPCDKHIHEREIYGEKNKEPWNIFGETSSKTFYVFIELRKKGEERAIDRIAGSGTWKGQRTDLLDHWVLCRISNKNGKDGPLELDEDDSEDDMLGTVPPSASIDSQHNGEFQLPTEGSSFGALHDTQGDSLFDARTESDGLNNGLFLNQLLIEGSSFEAIHDGQEDSVFDAVMASDGINNGFISNQLGYLDLSVLNPLKRSLSSLYCIEDETTWPCTSKRFRGNNNDGGNLENATLPSQLPPSPPLQQEQQQQAMLWSMGDGILGPPYQLPGSNCCN